MTLEPDGNGFRKQALVEALFGSEATIEPYFIEGWVVQLSRPDVRGSRTTG
jgi:hypothetical protein